MSQQMLRLARPTKIEFIRLRRRLATARRLHRVLRDRLLILTQELVALYREVVEHRLRVHEEIVRCERELIRASSYVAPWTFEEFSNVKIASFNVVVGSRIV
ncbi:MAG: V-type ATP synthase subunit D, partial [Zestosphaera sp.]